MRMPATGGRRTAGTESGSAIVDFVLIIVVLIPLVLAIIQIGLVLHVRNTLTTAASDGARVAAVDGAGPADGANRTRQMIRTSLGDRYAHDVKAHWSMSNGVRLITVSVESSVPALGLLGSVANIRVEGHAIGQRP